MLLINNDNPLDSIYYISYQFLSMIKEQNIESMDTEKVFELFKKEYNFGIDFSRFLLVIDYLFVNNCVEINENGVLKINVFK